MRPGRPTVAAERPDRDQAATGLVRAWRRTPLWLRLISATLALVALGLTLTGVFGVRLIRTYLVDQVDGQLRAAARAVTAPAEEMPGLEPGGPPLPSQFYLARLDSKGEVVRSESSVLTPTQPDLPELTFAE